MCTNMLAPIHPKCTCCQTVMEVGIIAEAAGSAYIEMKKTKVICAMYVLHTYMFNTTYMFHCDCCTALDLMRVGEDQNSAWKSV